jgi:dTDP-4-dehydrorhamnose 3,5-epimerase
MKILNTKFSDCKILQPIVHYDNRGIFKEIYTCKNYTNYLSQSAEFVQDNFSVSKKGVLRGLHFQKNFPQAKLVYVTLGTVFDVIVDLRENSPTFGQWESYELSQENHLQLFIPPGFAHGFLALSNTVHLMYKCSEYYHPEDEYTIHWKDSYLDISWPSNIEISTSQKDSLGKKLSYFFDL